MRKALKNLAGMTIVAALSPLLAVGGAIAGAFYALAWAISE